MSSAKQKHEFSRESLSALMEEVHKNPELLEKDWRKAVRDHFRLSPEQEKSLVELTPEKVKHIQDYLTKMAHQIRQGSTIRGELVTRPPHEQTAKLVHDVVVEVLAEGPPRS
jgi:hypothetical protein